MGNPHICTCALTGGGTICRTCAFCAVCWKMCGKLCGYIQIQTLISIKIFQWYDEINVTSNNAHHNFAPAQLCGTTVRTHNCAVRNCANAQSAQNAQCVPQCGIFRTVLLLCGCPPLNSIILEKSKIKQSFDFSQIVTKNSNILEKSKYSKSSYSRMKDWLELHNLPNTLSY